MRRIRISAPLAHAMVSLSADAYYRGRLLTASRQLARMDDVGLMRQAERMEAEEAALRATGRDGLPEGAYREIAVKLARLGPDGRKDLEPPGAVSGSVRRKG